MTRETSRLCGSEQADRGVGTLGKFSPSGTVALLTDFGQRDPFVAVMKAVMLQRNPDLRFLDLTHEIEPHNLEAAKYWLECTIRYAPRGTVFLCVVDPGVGGERPAVLAWGDDYAFVAPANGLLDGARCHIKFQTEILSETDSNNRTFHGRDIFAPIAASVASGQESAIAVGAPELVAASQARSTDRSLAASGNVIVVDHFGNLLTDISVPGNYQLEEAWIEPSLTSKQLAGLAGEDDDVQPGGAVPLPHNLGAERKVPVPCARTYSSVECGKPLALINSWQKIEVAVREARADLLFGGVGIKVHVRFRKR